MRDEIDRWAGNKRKQTGSEEKRYLGLLLFKLTIKIKLTI